LVWQFGGPCSSPPANSGSSLLALKFRSKWLRLIVGFTLSFGSRLNRGYLKRIFPNYFCFHSSFKNVTLHEVMLRYAIIFLIIALIAEAFGAGGVAGEASWIAHVLLVIAVIFIIISFVTGRRGPPAV
jgi:uncharacterized membrane protein YtjA (UPF0391 family)